MADMQRDVLIVKNITREGPGLLQTPEKMNLLKWQATK
jgi:hypothetical protein